MRNVLLWSDDNKLSVNLSKCKEIVFRRPSVKLDILPDLLADIERVSCAKLLGVFIDCRLKFTEHVDCVIKISNQRLCCMQNCIAAVAKLRVNQFYRYGTSSANRLRSDI